MNYSIKRLAFTTIASILVAIVSSATGTGIYRTAITLTNGTQEIFPDSTVTRFTYSHVPNGNRTKHLLNVIKNGEVVRTIDTDSIVELNYGEMTYYEQFAGDWYLVASPYGEPNDQGIMVMQVVSMPYHAVLPAPGTADYGKYIYCHIDSVAHRKGLKYDANFRLRYSYDEAAQAGSITMIVDDQHPITAMEYFDAPSTYAYWDDQSTWYNGVQSGHDGGDSGHRYMYFLCQNWDTWVLEAEELPAQWTAADQSNLDFVYRFPGSKEIHWVVALDIPYVHTEKDLVGEIDMFSSPRLQRTPYVKPVEE